MGLGLKPIFVARYFSFP